MGVAFLTKAMSPEMGTSMWGPGSSDLTYDVDTQVC